MKQMLSVTFLGIALASAPASAQSNLYLGLDLASSSNNFDIHDSYYGSFSPDNESRAFKFKLGFEGYDGWRTQGYYQHETFDEPLFDPYNDELSEIGFDIIKAFGSGPGITPFLQAGIGVGWMDLHPDYYYDDTISEYSLKVGAGVIFWLSPAIDAVVGVDLQQRYWQDVSYYDSESGRDEYIETDDTSARAYIGINVYF